MLTATKRGIRDAGDTLTTRPVTQVGIHRLCIALPNIGHTWSLRCLRCLIDILCTIPISQTVAAGHAYFRYRAFKQMKQVMKNIETSSNEGRTENCLIDISVPSKCSSR